jgi:hypothetical protein
MGTRKLRFGTSAWFAAMQGTIADRLAAFRARATAEAIERVTFSMAEIALDPPSDVAEGATHVGWYCRVERGRLAAFDTTDLDRAEYRLFAPFALLERLAGFDTGDDAARASEYENLTRSAVASGQIRVEGIRPKAPREFATIHNTMARITL